MTTPETPSDLTTAVQRAVLDWITQSGPTREEKLAEVRRWYAGHALAGYLASFAGCDGAPDPRRVAEFALTIASAMVRAELDAQQDNVTVTRDTLAALLEITELAIDERGCNDGIRRAMNEARRQLAPLKKQE